MRVIIFEDDNVNSIRPLIDTRPVFELKCGMGTLRERIIRNFPKANISYFVREIFKDYIRKKYPNASVNDTDSILDDELVFVNARVLFPVKLPVISQKEYALKDKGKIVFARVNGEKIKKMKIRNLRKILQILSTKLKSVDLKFKIIEYPFNIIENNAECIREDFKLRNIRGIKCKKFRYNVIYGSKKDVYIAEGAEIGPFVCIDTTGGPVFIEKGVKIHPFTRIEGPCFIGEGTVITGAKIRQGCYIGPDCRIGGEIEESIFHGYSNKYHDGFVGHSYIGEWVNLGALTTTSDLKNDYTPVSIIIKNKVINTGKLKIGSFIGDHTKTGIGTLLNTGSIIGPMCMIVTSGVPLPKYIPPGTMYKKGKVIQGYNLDKVVDIAKKTMARRNRTLSVCEKAILENVFVTARKEREKFKRFI